MKVPYQNPTLLGVAYASRLFRDLDTPSSFEELCRTAAPAIDLESADHGRALLEWLNKWGCRIKVTSFPARSSKLAEWFRRWNSELPHADLTELETEENGIFARAYDALRTAADLGPTAASKALFAVRPDAAIPWDSPIRNEFDLDDTPQGYQRMLDRSQREARLLIADATRFGVDGQRSLAREVGSPGSAIPKLLDEYHWVTITRGHQIPRSNELKQWVRWAG